MGYLATPRHYGLGEFEEYVRGLTWSKGWKPKFPTLHNTGVPSLTQWLAYGATAQERWGASLNRYYQSMGWHSGPHVVCCPDYVWVLCDPEEDGVSVSCWNRVTFGIEMVGDFRSGSDDPAGPEGAKVVENAVGVLAALAKHPALGWSIGTIVKGVGGLHFHRECAADGHPCPGDRIDKGEVLRRVLERMGAGGGPRVESATPASGLPVDFEEQIRWLQSRAGVAADGQFGPLTAGALVKLIGGGAK